MGYCGMLFSKWAKKWSVSNAAVMELTELLVSSDCKKKTSTIAISETASILRARLEYQNTGLGILWRNNVGAAKTEDGRHVRFGLANSSSRINSQFKSSDLIGITEVVISNHHIGRKIGIFTSIEVKKEGWKLRGGDRENAQARWISYVISRGGIAYFSEGGSIRTNDIEGGCTLR